MRETRYARVKIEIEYDEGVDPDHVYNEMDYSFDSKTPGAKVVDTNIEEFEEKYPDPDWERER